jgi:hypothetical protein
MRALAFFQTIHELIYTSASTATRTLKGKEIGTLVAWSLRIE